MSKRIINLLLLGLTTLITPLMANELASGWNNIDSFCDDGVEKARKLHYAGARIEWKKHANDDTSKEWERIARHGLRASRFVAGDDKLVHCLEPAVASVSQDGYVLFAWIHLIGKSVEPYFHGAIKLLIAGEQASSETVPFLLNRIDELEHHFKEGHKRPVREDRTDKDNQGWNWDAQLCVDTVVDHKKGIVHCDRAIDSGDLTQRSLSATYQNRGWHYGELGDIEKALEDYQRAIDLDPGQTSAYYNRGLIYERRGDYQRAVDDFVKAYQSAPESDMIRDKAQEYEIIK